jgi:hypothetical protein
MESMMDDLQAVLKQLSLPFVMRSVARELTTCLLEARPAGELLLKVDDWALAWGVDTNQIWSTIEQLQQVDFWVVRQGIDSGTLSCPLIASSAKAISKKRQKAKLGMVKTQALMDRANALELSNVGPSAVSEVSTTIPKDQRKIALSGGYSDWLPAANFGVSGLIFRPDQGLKAQLLKEFTGICVESALALMFEDLKYSKDRPSIPAFSFWIRRWIKANQDRVTAIKSEAEISSMVAQKLDEY